MKETKSGYHCKPADFGSIVIRFPEKDFLRLSRLARSQACAAGVIRSVIYRGWFLAGSKMAAAPAPAE
jgi:hypothetical protein